MSERLLAELGIKAAAEIAEKIVGGMAPKAMQEAFFGSKSVYARSASSLGDGAVGTTRLSPAALDQWRDSKTLTSLTNRTERLDLPGVTITVANNPITAFDRALPRFVQRIEQAEDRYQGTGKTEHQLRRDIFEETQAIKTDFAHDLMTVWHGMSVQPGMALLEDKQLAIGGISQDRVAQVRQLFGLSAKREHYQAPSPFETALGHMSENIKEYPDRYRLDNTVWPARARFFGFDHDDMIDKLSLPQLQHSISRAYGTPLEWMPFEPTPKLANLFHGTVSRSLDSIIKERALLPSSELRLRAIEHTTGESAGNEFAHREISMTRNFTIAFNYHSHSPTVISDFPIVFGISRDVVPRASSAGMLEPGELLIGKLHFGTASDGLTKTDVTHLYVPGREVSTVSSKLSRNHIDGVRVLSFNDLEAPKWNNTIPKELRRNGLGTSW